MQDFWNWVLAVWPLLLFGGGFYVARNFFPAWIRRSAEFGFDVELEKLRGEISSSEARLKAALDAKQKELDSLREATFSSSTSRAVALETRRLKAAEEIWNAVVDLQKLKFAAETAGGFKLSKIAERVRSEPNLQQFMDIIIKSVPVDALPGTDAVRHRPFVTESVWASYSAFSLILHLAATRLKMAQLGLADADSMLKVEHSNKVIATALPHHKDWIETVGIGGYHMLVEELEALLLSEIKNMLEGKEADVATVRRNSDILKAVNEAQAEAQAVAAEAPKPQGN